MNTDTVRDPGLQPERTLLAWRRTLLTASCVFLICARACLDRPSPTRLAAAALLGASAVTIGVGLAHRRRRYRANPQDPYSTPTALLLASSLAPAAAALMYLFSLQ